MLLGAELQMRVRKKRLVKHVEKRLIVLGCK
jgi:hypothetical protein